MAWMRTEGQWLAQGCDQGEFVFNAKPRGPPLLFVSVL